MLLSSVSEPIVWNRIWNKEMECWRRRRRRWKRCDVNQMRWFSAFLSLKNASDLCYLYNFLFCSAKICGLFERGIIFWIEMIAHYYLRCSLLFLLFPLSCIWISDQPQKMACNLEATKEKVTKKEHGVLPLSPLSKYITLTLPHVSIENCVLCKYWEWCIITAKQIYAS